MSNIHLKIDDQQLTATEGQTVLEVCRANGIPVPTLCHHEGLCDVGACRLCIVEVEGQGRPTPSCTTPATDQMVVRTQTPKLENLRRQTIELLFSERNHICPFCPASGNCELQRTAYEHGMDHVRFDYFSPRLPTDNSHPRIALDHNRCILCSRCVRACDEWIGAHVLDFDHRGLKTLLVADDGVPLGESSCVSCGTCVTVCPTGALFEKRSAHWQGRLPLELTETVCPGCGVGCRIHVSVRHRQIGEIRSAGGPSGIRVLCVRGRFGLASPEAPRVSAIKVKRGHQWVDRPLHDLFTDIAHRLSSGPVAADPSRVIMLISPRLPLETIAACQTFMTKVVGSDRWALSDRDNASAVKEGLGHNGHPAPLAGLADLDEADMVLLLGCNLERSHGVIASYVRRAVQHRRARLVKINPRHTWMTDWTDLHIRLHRRKDSIVLAAVLKYLIDMGVAKIDAGDELTARLAKLKDDDIAALTGVPAESLRKVATYFSEAKRPMILCGRGLSRRGAAGMKAAMNLVKATNRKTPSGRWRLMSLAMGANSAGARLLGDSGLDPATLDPHTADIAFVVLGDDAPTWPKEWIEKLRTINYVVTLLAREHEVMQVGHVVVPTASWSERSGTYVSLEGRLQKGVALMPPTSGCVDEKAFFEQLTRVWRGPYGGSSSGGLPEPLRHLADGHMVPCGPGDRTVDLEGLAALVGD